MFYAGVSLGSAGNRHPPPPRPLPLPPHAHCSAACAPCIPVSAGPRAPIGSGERKFLSPDGDALCLPQTAFSDFLMGSSKDLAKHIRVVVSGPGWQAEWAGLAGREAASAPVHIPHPLPLPACSVTGLT